MNIICRIRDEHIGQRSMNVHSTTFENAAVGFVMHENRMALIYHKNGNYYTLPGGTVKEEEDYRGGFIRNVLEQTGCRIDPKRVIGATVEERTLIGYRQTTYVFYAEVTDYQENNSVVWVSKDKALTLVATAYNDLDVDDARDLYQIKFQVKRDQLILEDDLKKH